MDNIRLFLMILVATGFSVRAMENVPCSLMDDPDNWFQLDYKRSNRVITAQLRQGNYCARMTKSLTINFTDVGVYELREGGWYLCANPDKYHSEIMATLRERVGKFRRVLNRRNKRHYISATPDTENNI